MDHGVAAMALCDRKFAMAIIIPLLVPVTELSDSTSSVIDVGDKSPLYRMW
jgi:hypothetical protein